MKRVFAFSMIAVAVLCGITGCGEQAAGESVDMSVRMLSTATSADAGQMLADARAAVVGISVDYPDSYSIGSGFAISGDGLILTNNHVVEGGGVITLYYADKTTGSAKLLWTDAGLDVAVLQADRQIPYLDTNTTEVSIGEPVYALGTPLTLEFKHTITHGIVSALNRTLESQSFSGQTSFMQSLIQHDAAINPGNSGGPLINAAGQVVGINTLKATEGEGLGFAVPIEIGKIAVEKLAQNPSFTSAYLGVFGFDSDIALAYGETLSSNGVYVVSTDSPASDAGISKGDLIVRVAGREIVNLLDLKKAVLSFDHGEAVLVEYIRNGETRQTLVTLK